VLVPVGAYFIRLARHHRATIFGGLGATVGLLTSLFYKRLMLIKVSSHCGVWVFCMYVCMEIVILSKRTGRFAQNDKIQSIRSCKMFPWCTNHVRVRKKEVRNLQARVILYKKRIRIRHTEQLRRTQGCC